MLCRPSNRFLKTSVLSAYSTLNKTTGVVWRLMCTFPCLYYTKMTMQRHPLSLPHHSHLGGATIPTPFLPSWRYHPPPPLPNTCYDQHTWWWHSNLGGATIPTPFLPSWRYHPPSPLLVMISTPGDDILTWGAPPYPPPPPHQNLIWVAHLVMTF